MKTDSNISGTILFCTFLALKLTHTIDWSWWWVFAPVWVPAVIGSAIVSIAKAKLR